MYKDFFEKSTDGMLILGDDKFIDCNTAMLKMLHYENKEQLLNMHPSEISPEFQPDGRSSFEKSNAMIAQTLKDGSNTFEWIHKRANGEEFWVEVVITKIVDNNKILFFGVLRDIAEKKKLEAELEIANKSENKKINERMELALLGNKDGVWDWNVTTNEVYYSPRWKEMLGYEEHELSNDFSVWQERVHPDDLENTLECIDNHMKDKTQYYESKHRLKHKNGTWVWILARAKKILDEDGTIVRLSGTHTDVTDEKNIELKLHERSKILDDSINEIYIYKKQHLNP